MTSLPTTVQNATGAMDGPDVFQRLKDIGCIVEPCGSRVTCNPAPTDTDRDYLVIVPQEDDAVSDVVALLSNRCYQWEGSEHYQQAARNDFMSWRHDDINLIVTRNHDFVKRHRAATHVCARLNLLRKDDRVAVFQAVLYGTKWADGAAIPDGALPDEQPF